MKVGRDDNLLLYSLRINNFLKSPKNSGTSEKFALPISKISKFFKLDNESGNRLIFQFFIINSVNLLNFPIVSGRDTNSLVLFFASFDPN